MEMECLAILNGHKQDVKCVKWHPVERVLFSSSYDDTIKIWMCDDDEDGEWYCHDTLVFLPKFIDFYNI